MTVKEEAPSPEHQNLVGHLVNWIVQEGFQISCANYGNYTRCTEVEKYIPDAKGYRRNIELSSFGESKTADDIDNQHTKDQFSEFGKRVMSEGKSKDQSCPFYIAIPKGSEGVLRKVLSELGLLRKQNVKWQSFAV
jgi:hypothetical protein